jgi:alpha-amylase
LQPDVRSQSGNFRRLFSYSAFSPIKKLFQVIDVSGNEAVKYGEYTYIGRVTEFRHGKNLGDVVRKNFGQKLSYLRNFGQPWSQLSPMDAFVFIDNHDNQRGHGAGGFGSILTFFEANMYKIANAFQLAWQYGHVRIMSSYMWPRNIVGGTDTVINIVDLQQKF